MKVTESTPGGVPIILAKTAGAACLPPPFPPQAPLWVRRPPAYTV